MNQKFPTDGAILKTATGEPVYAAPTKSPSFTTDVAIAARPTPITAHRSYGVPNNREVKAAAEKETGRILFWSDPAAEIVALADPQLEEFWTDQALAGNDEQASTKIAAAEIERRKAAGTWNPWTA